MQTAAGARTIGTGGAGAAAVPTHDAWDEGELASGIRALADGRVVCRGDTSLLDLQWFGITVEPTEVTAATIGAAIQNSLGRLARSGDSAEVGSVGARVLSTDEGRIKRVVVEMASTVAAASV